MKPTKRKERRKPARAATPDESGHPQWWAGIAALFAALALAFIVYGPALHGPFVLDDLYLPFFKPHVSSALTSWILGVRPVLMFSFWLNFQSGGQDPYAYHAVNVLLHFLDTAAVFFIVRKLLRWAKTEGKLLNLLSGFAAGVFLLHPLQTESVAYVASRSEVLSVLFFNLAFLVFLYRRKEGVSLLESAGILILYAAAAGSKEHTVILPALLLLTDYFWNPGFQAQGIVRNWKLYSLIAAAGALLALPVLTLLRHSTTAGFGAKGLHWYEYFPAQCRVIWDYIRLFVMPFGQNVDPDIAVSRGFTDPLALVGCAALIAVSFAAWHFRRRYTLASFGWLVFLLLLAPTSSFMPIADAYAERRVYLPFIGLLLITVDLLRRWKTSHAVLAAAMGGILLVEGMLTYQRSVLWGDPIALWQDAAAKSPHKIRPNFQLAKAYFDAGQFGPAAEQYERTARIQPPGYSLLVDWALALQGLRQYDAAIEKLQQALAQHPSAHIYAELAKEYGLTNNFDEALRYLDKAEKADPRYVMTYVYRGMTYASQGHKANAEAQYRRALALDSGNTVAQGLLQSLTQGR
jgi:hypothetical protein